MFLRLTGARTIIVALCFMILFTLFSPPVDAQKRQRAGGPGYEITCSSGNSRLVTIASSDGIISTQYEEAADPKNQLAGRYCATAMDRFLESTSRIVR